MMKLHDYQKRAVQRVIDQPELGLFLDMGLGKTLITLTAVEQLIREYTVSRVLVIAPLKVAEDTWNREVDKWGIDLTISKILGSTKKRTAAAEASADLYIINRDNVKWLVDKYPADKWRWDMVVIDELSGFKNNKAGRFKALRSVRPWVDRIVGLTGTPSPNGYMDLWAEIYLLDQGKRLGKFIGKYRETYFRPGNGNGYVVYDYKLLPGADKAIQAKISDIVVSMRAEDYIELPERIDRTVGVELPEKALKEYRKLEEEQILGLEDGEDITALNAAAVMNKLLQYSGGGVYADDGSTHYFHEEKLKALDEIIESEESVLVFYGYRHERERLIERYKARELKTPEDIADWNAGKVKVLIAHPASVGYGLNLQEGGHVVAWYSLPWSLELYQQANARLYRQGQNMPVVINHLISKGTVDERVMKCLESKDMGQAALMAALKERR